MTNQWSKDAYLSFGFQSALKIKLYLRNYFTDTEYEMIYVFGQILCQKPVKVKPEVLQDVLGVQHSNEWFCCTWNDDNGSSWWTLHVLISRSGISAAHDRPANRPTRRRHHWWSTCKLNLKQNVKQWKLGVQRLTFLYDKIENKGLHTCK